MPEAFERERKKKGRRVRTVTKGPNKGKLIAVGGPHPVLGGKKGDHGSKKRRRKVRRREPRDEDFARFM